MYQFTIEEHLKNERATALTVVCLKYEFPVFTFEGKENGRGGYTLVAYHDNYNFLTKSQNKLIKYAWNIYRAIPVIESELKIAGLME